MCLFCKGGMLTQAFTLQMLTGEFSEKHYFTITPVVVKPLYESQLDTLLFPSVSSLSLPSS